MGFLSVDRVYTVGKRVETHNDSCTFLFQVLRQEARELQKSWIIVFFFFLLLFLLLFSSSFLESFTIFLYLSTNFASPSLLIFSLKSLFLHSNPQSFINESFPCSLALKQLFSYFWPEVSKVIHRSVFKKY